MSAALAAAVAVTFVWLGMVLAISFLEAPLKFQAPGVDLRIGLGIGRLVFRALNIAECLFAAALIAMIIIVDPPAGAITAGAVAVFVLLAQVGAVRPRLSRRSDRIIAGQDAPRSRAHHAYVALEVVKVAALIVAGALLFTA